MSGVSNLVQDARLETSFHSQYLYHVYHDSDPLAGHRSILRREYWERRKHLGAGGFGSVWLEECVKGQQKGEMRAVKEIKRPQTLIDYNRELEALFKFSHARVRFPNNKIVSKSNKFIVVCKMLRQVAGMVR